MQLKTETPYWLGSAPIPSLANPAQPALDSNPTTTSNDAEVHSEALRKFLHMLPGLLPFLFLGVPHPDPLPMLALTVVAALCVFGTLVFLSFESRVRRRGEANFYSTVFSYPLIIMATLLLFPQHAECTMVVVIILGLGDGSACLMGRRFGRTHKLPWNKQKSWAGLFGFVLVSAPLAILAYWLEAHNPGVSLQTAVLCAGSAALVAAIAETIPVKLTDNLRVGLAAAVTVCLTTVLLVP